MGLLASTSLLEEAPPRRPGLYPSLLKLDWSAPRRTGCRNPGGQGSMPTPMAASPRGKPYSSAQGEDGLPDRPGRDAGGQRRFPRSGLAGDQASREATRRNQRIILARGEPTCQGKFESKRLLLRPSRPRRASLLPTEADGSSARRIDLPQGRYPTGLYPSALSARRNQWRGGLWHPICPHLSHRFGESTHPGRNCAWEVLLSQRFKAHKGLVTEASQKPTPCNFAGAVCGAGKVCANPHI